jgi:hypothetical protein
VVNHSFDRDLFTEEWQITLLQSYKVMPDVLSTSKSQKLLLKQSIQTDEEGFAHTC